MPFGPLYLTFIIKTLVKSVRWGVLHIPLPISTIFQYVFVIVCYTNGDGSKVERGHTLVESPVEIRIICEVHYVTSTVSLFSKFSYIAISVVYDVLCFFFKKNL